MSLPLVILIEPRISAIYPMPAPIETLYEALGVPRNAKLTDITRAYNRIRAEMRKETAAPDRKRADRVQKAYEVLSDEQRRDEYDASLAAPDRKRLARTAGLGAGALAVVAAGAWFVMRPAPVPPAPARNPQDILYWATASVGRVQSIEMSGQTVQLGLAFAVGDGVMVTPCKGITPGAQLFVHFQPRALPARVTMASEPLGLCKLAVAGVGSWPLPVGVAPIKVGDKVYTTKMSAAGEVALVDGSVKRVLPESGGTVIEATLPIGSSDGGAPLLDVYGRVIAIAHAQPEGAGRYVVVPAGWILDTRALRPKAAPTPAPGGGTEIAQDPKDAKQPKEVPQNRREKLQEAFRPPPQVPDDL